MSQILDLLLNHLSSGRRVRAATCVLCLASAAFWTGCSTPGVGSQSRLKESLTFHAGFDNGLDADFARGDAKIHHLDNLKKPRQPKPGLPPGGSFSLAKGEGRFGNALRFHKKSPEVVLFKAAKNIAYQSSQWEGTVSLWLKVDPASELENGFCDPMQITSRNWNDAAFFVEFCDLGLCKYFDAHRLGVRWNHENPFKTLEEPTRTSLYSFGSA